MTGEKAVKYTELEKKSSSKLNGLIETYKKNPYNARVIFLNGNKNEFNSSRLVMFEHNNGDFEICIMQKKFGVSVTNRMYSREKKIGSIIYSKKKFYCNQNNKFTQLTYGSLYNFIHSWAWRNVITESEVFNILQKKFSWIRFISENKVLHATAFNTFVRYKLYNLKDALRHLFKVPWPIIKVILSNNTYTDFASMDMTGCNVLFEIKRWKEVVKYLINVENLKSEMYHHHMFNDACRMAKILDKRVNCSWSISRLIEEHDKWSREITHIVLSNEPVYDLTIAKIYRDFAEFSGYKLLLTNVDVLGEGMMQNHCVGTYISSINAGSCGIFNVEGFTLEVRYGTTWDFTNNNTKSNTFYLSQFRGRYNSSAPKHLDDAVKKKIEEFNEILKDKYNTPEYKSEELPVVMNF